jgi:hypothetical protein
MKIQGRIIFKSDIQRGVSQRTGNDWQSMDVVIEYHETPESRWTNKLCARAFNDTVKIVKAFDLGREVVAVIDHDVNEYNGRYYNELRLQKVEAVGAAAEPQPAENEAAGETAAEGPEANATGTTTEENNDDLPF